MRDRGPSSLSPDPVDHGIGDRTVWLGMLMEDCLITDTLSSVAWREEQDGVAVVVRQLSEGRVHQSAVHTVSPPARTVPCSLHEADRTVDVLLSALEPTNETSGMHHCLTSFIWPFYFRTFLAWRLTWSLKKSVHTKYIKVHAFVCLSLSWRSEVNTMDIKFINNQILWQ